VGIELWCLRFYVDQMLVCLFVYHLFIFLNCLLCLLLKFGCSVSFDLWYIVVLYELHDFFMPYNYMQAALIQKNSIARLNNTKRYCLLPEDDPKGLKHVGVF